MHPNSKTTQELFVVKMQKQFLIHCSLFHYFFSFSMQEYSSVDEYHVWYYFYKSHIVFDQYGKS